ncbi:MAG: hypothetical protein Ct9H90mP18_01170 [Gammaproteobacteria bacterium]|nr:MAG: hypothetical protein Ct9H90mP18_01170 [Gammaproteobacteria bacterium]
MFELARGYKEQQMSAYVNFKKQSLAREIGYTATKHQREVGTGFFDEVTQVITGVSPLLRH